MPFRVVSFDYSPSFSSFASYISEDSFLLDGKIFTGIHFAPLLPWDSIQGEKYIFQTHCLGAVNPACITFMSIRLVVA